MLIHRASRARDGPVTVTERGHRGKLLSREAVVTKAEKERGIKQLTQIPESGMKE